MLSSFHASARLTHTRNGRFGTESEIGVITFALAAWWTERCTGLGMSSDLKVRRLNFIIFIVCSRFVCTLYFQCVRCFCGGAGISWKAQIRVLRTMRGCTGGRNCAIWRCIDISVADNVHLYLYSELHPWFDAQMNKSVRKYTFSSSLSTLPHMSLIMCCPFFTHTQHVFAIAHIMTRSFKAKRVQFMPQILELQRYVL